jgi:hypothetical protein
LSTIYYGFVETFTDSAHVILSTTGTLPSTDKTLNDVTVIDYGEEGHSYQAYLTEIASLVQDDASKLSSADIASILKQAVEDFGRDKPLYVSKKVQGDGTGSYTLQSILKGLWKYDVSKINSIEYPQGDVPPTMLKRDEWYIYDDGTQQDGSNLKLVFNDYAPATSEYFVIKFSLRLRLTESWQNFPDTNFNFRNICLLAGAEYARRLSAVYAQSIDSTLSVDAVDYRDKSRKYEVLAKQLQERYNKNVLGGADLEVIAGETLYQLNIETPQDADISGDLFH